MAISIVASNSGVADIGGAWPSSKPHLRRSESARIAPFPAYHQQLELPMAEIKVKNLDECIGRFVELANVMNKEKIPKGVISTALMTASGIYATFIAAGNEGGLTESGMDKITAAYRGQLEQVQDVKKSRTEQRANT
jgi:hypothetical protein